MSRDTILTPLSYFDFPGREYGLCAMGRRKALDVWANGVIEQSKRNGHAVLSRATGPVLIVSLRPAPQHAILTQTRNSQYKRGDLLSRKVLNVSYRLVSISVKMWISLKLITARGTRLLHEELVGRGCIYVMARPLNPARV